MKNQFIKQGGEWVHESLVGSFPLQEWKAVFLRARAFLRGRSVKLTFPILTVDPLIHGNEREAAAACDTAVHKGEGKEQGHRR